MYLQITRRCNMLCPHCCFSCTAEGEDMSLDTFRKALEIAKEYEDSICIGGGEPTLHPDFEAMLLEAIAVANKGNPVFIVTNGSNERLSLLLANLTARGIIDAKLSYDQFHNLDMVDAEVIEEFRRLGNLWGPPRGVDEPTRSLKGLSKRGRARQFKEAGEDCACAAIFVAPNGKIYQCGCQDAPQIGHVDTGFHSVAWGECCHSDYYKEELTNAKHMV